jgi:hypothetical protein
VPSTPGLDPCTRLAPLCILSASFLCPSILLGDWLAGWLAARPFCAPGLASNASCSPPRTSRPAALRPRVLEGQGRSARGWWCGCPRNCASWQPSKRRRQQADQTRVRLPCDPGSLAVRAAAPRCLLAKLVGCCEAATPSQLALRARCSPATPSTPSTQPQAVAGARKEGWVLDQQRHRSAERLQDDGLVAAAD